MGVAVGRYSMAGRGASGMEAAVAAAAAVPGPGDYDVVDLDAIGLAAAGHRGITMGVRRAEKNQGDGLGYPSPGEYHPDGDEENHQGRLVGVDIAKTTVGLCAY